MMMRTDCHCSTARRRNLLLASALAGIAAIAATLSVPREGFAAPLTKELIETISKAQREHLSALQQGKGQATVSIQKEYAGGDGPGPGSGRLIVDFMFKGAKTRTDAYVQNPDGTRGELAWKWIDTVETELAYGPGPIGAHITDGGIHGNGGYRKIGHDFHPETFIRVIGLTTEEALRRFQSGAVKSDCHLDGNGLLTVTARGLDGTTVQLVLDSRVDYSIVSLDSKAVMDELGSLNLTKYKAEFSPREGIPRRIVYENAFQLKGQKASTEKNRLCIKEHCEVQITSFDQTEVDARVFELDALNIPPGTRMQDNQRGLLYKYKTMESVEPLLKGILDRPPRGTADQTVPKPPTLPEPVAPNASIQPQTALSGGSARLLWIAGLVIACCIAVGGIALAMRKWRGGRRAKM
jgi:hypothetical protein